MKDVSLQPDHPVDELPDYLRGCATGSNAIERHLAGCAPCRSELELLRSLVEFAPTPLSDVERQRLQPAFEARGAGSHRWLSWTWRVAAGIAVVLMSVGVLRVVREGGTSEWDPGLALEGWGQEVADLGLDAGEVRLALGVGLLDDPALDLPLEEAGADLESLTLPWEEEDR